jgi:NAD-dependent dihydropyrimidine dehydrogenase PreA subunit
MTKRTLRDIIEIDDDLCDGCGLCIPSCEEGALVLVDGKVRLAEDARCDGAGACLGHCPHGALRIIQREAVVFDERFAAAEAGSVQEVSVREVSAEPLVRFGKSALGLQGLPPISGGCPGSRTMGWHDPSPSGPQAAAVDQPSELRQWPIQLHLLSSGAPFLRGRELLLAADCVAFSLGGFHGALLSGRSLAVACPKLDDPTGYEEKLAEILDGCSVPALRVAIMEVPCCGGLVRLATRAAQRAGYQGEIEVIVISRFGEILQRQQLAPGRGVAAEEGCACAGG